jgi:hypothetical protein
MPWIDAKKKLPPTETIVLCRLAHFKGKLIEEVVMKKVNEDDCDWRTWDDNSELNYDWHVAYWFQGKKKAKAKKNAKQ